VIAAMAMAMLTTMTMLVLVLETLIRPFSSWMG
jgi:hypothetical protein